VLPGIQGAGADPSCSPGGSGKVTGKFEILNTKL